jgi:hypothetical protein
MIDDPSLQIGGRGGLKASRFHSPAVLAVQGDGSVADCEGESSAGMRVDGEEVLGNAVLSLEAGQSIHW